MNLTAAFFDVDGTLTSERTWKGLIDYFHRHHQRRFTHLAFLATHYPFYVFRRLGLVSETGFRRRWAADLAWYVRGCSLDSARVVWEWSVHSYLSQFWRSDSLDLLKQHQRAGDLVVIVSSAPAPMIEQVASQFGVQHFVATRLQVADGRFTGRSLPPVCIDAHKASLSRAYLEEHNLPVDLQASYAYADSLTDLPMLEMVGHPVAVYPDLALKDIACQRGWRIIPG